MPNRIELKGFKEFDQKLKNLPKDLQEEVGFEVSDAGKNWEGLAKRSAPKDQGKLAQQIRSVDKGVMLTEIVANVDYAAYVEWGTKTKVRVPSDIADYAAQFRGGRSSGNAKEMIYAWMKRVGIPAQAQYIVFISIIVTGIRPHPYFFIQRPIVEKELFANIRRILNTPR